MPKRKHCYPVEVWLMACGIRWPISTAEDYVLRGKARMKLGDNEGAAQDVVNALSIEQTNLDALVLRGELQQAGIVIDVTLSTR